MRNVRAVFLDTVNQYGMFRPGEDVLVGFSGGADSVCLLALLFEYREKFGIRLRAAHVNHGLRGVDADADERFAVTFCESRNIPISVSHADIASIAAEKGQSTELCAREFRYAYFQSLGADKIVTAHTGSDAAETMLMNLARGASLRGLCAIPPVRENVVRPLICITREEVEAFCLENGLSYVTDQTNFSLDYTRNRVRWNVVPPLKEITPSFEFAVLRCIENLRLEDDYISIQADGAYKNALSENRLDVSVLKALHPAICLRVLFRFCREVGGADVEEKHLLLLMRNMDVNGFAVQLPGGTRVSSDGTELFVSYIKPPVPETEQIKIEKSALTKTEFHGFYLDFELRGGDGTKVFKPDFIDFSKIDDIIEIRCILPGDAIRLTRRNCTKTLKKYYTEKKIPASVWRTFPVITDSGGVIWAYGAGADAYRTATDKTEKILIIHSESDKNEQ